MQSILPDTLPPLVRIGSILVTAVGLHLVSLGLRAMSRRVLASTAISEAKVQTLTGFATSVVWFKASVRV